MSQCGRGQARCRLGGVGTAAARCWVGVPNHVTRLSVVQDLVAFRLATCLFLKITTLDASRIPNLDAEKITDGTLDILRIPNLDAEKITDGTLLLARIPILDAGRIPS